VKHVWASGTALRTGLCGAQRPPPNTPGQIQGARAEGVASRPAMTPCQHRLLVPAATRAGCSAAAISRAGVLLCPLLERASAESLDGWPGRATTAGGVPPRTPHMISLLGGRRRPSTAALRTLGSGHHKGRAPAPCARARASRARAAPSRTVRTINPDPSDAPQRSWPLPAARPRQTAGRRAALP